MELKNRLQENSTVMLDKQCKDKKGKIHIRMDANKGSGRSRISHRGRKSQRERNWRGIPTSPPPGSDIEGSARSTKYQKKPTSINKSEDQTQSEDINDHIFFSAHNFFFNEKKRIIDALFVVCRCD